MKRILVAINGSKHSEKAADFAAELAKELSARIVLIFVMPRPDDPRDFLDYEPTLRDIPRFLREDLRQDLRQNPAASYLSDVSRQIVTKIGARIEKKGVEFEAVFDLGKPVEKIIETARTKKVGLIVVGTHGRRRIGRLWSLGGVSSKIIEKSPVPVLVVP